MARPNVNSNTFRNEDDSIFVAVDKSGPRVLEANDPKKRVPRPVNAFILFSNEQRAKLTKQFPQIGKSEISVKLGHEWHKLDDTQKTYYFEKAHQLELEHRKKYPHYEFCPNKMERRTTSQYINQDIELDEGTRKGFKRRILEYSSDRCMNPDLFRNRTQSNHTPYTHGTTGFRHPIGSYEPRVYITKQRCGDAYEGSKSLLKATRKSGHRVKRPKRSYPWSWRYKPADESLIAQNNLVSLLNDTTMSTTATEGLYSPSVIGTHLQNPQSQLYHEESAKRALCQMHRGNSFNSICDQVLEEGPHAGRYNDGCPTIDDSALNMIHSMTTQDMTQDTSQTTSEDSSLPCSIYSDKESEISDLPSINSLISNSNMVEFPFSFDNSSEEIQGAIPNAPMTKNVGMEEIQHIGTSHSNDNVKVPSPSSFIETAFSMASSAYSPYVPSQFSSDEYGQPTTDIDSIQPSLSSTDLQHLEGTYPFTHIEEAPELISIQDDIMPSNLLGHYVQPVDKKLGYLDTFSNVKESQKIFNQETTDGIHVLHLDSEPKLQSHCPNTTTNRSLLKPFSTANVMSSTTDSVVSAYSSENDSFVLQGCDQSNLPADILSTVPKITSEYENSKVQDADTSDSPKGCRAILLVEEGNATISAADEDDGDIRKEADTTVDVDMVDGKAACRFTVSELLNKTAQEVQELMTSGKFEIFVVSTDPQSEHDITSAMKEYV